MSLQTAHVLPLPAKLMALATWMCAGATAIALVSCGASDEQPAAADGVAPSQAESAPQTPTQVTIAAFAGTGSPSFTGDGGPANEAGFYAPTGVALDGAGNLYISADNRVRRVDGETGVITTIAGTGKNRYNGDDGPATEATLAEPKGIAVDSSGNVFVASNGSGRIRKVDAATGVITTVAGGGVGDRLRQEFGDGGPATKAMLRLPVAIEADSLGNLFIATGNLIRRVDAATGIISVFAGTGERGITGDGGPATLATMSEPSAMALDGRDNLYIADRDNHRVRRIDGVTGVITTLAGIGTPFERDSLFYRGEFSYDISLNPATGAGYAGDGGPAAKAMLSVPTGVAVGPDGNVYAADGVVRVRKIDTTTGIISTVVASEAKGTQESGKIQIHTGVIGAISAIAVDALGDVFVADFKNNVVHKVAASSLAQ